MAPKKPWWDVAEDGVEQPLGPTPVKDSTVIEPPPPKASVSPGEKPWWEVDLAPAEPTTPAPEAEPTPEEVSTLSMENRLTREEQAVTTGAKTLQRVAKQAVESGAFPAVPQVYEELAQANQTYPDLMPPEVSEHFEQKAEQPVTLFGKEVPGWFRTALEAMPVLNPMLSASDYSEGKTSLGTAYIEGLPIRALSRTVRGVFGDEDAPKTNPLTKIGLAASTLSRPAAALSRAITDNMMADRGMVDPRTGEPMKHKDSTEIFDEVLDTLAPVPGTRRAQVSYIDVAANISRLNGGTGTEWPIYVGGLAGDILLDPAFYLTGGGSSVSKASSQAQRILQRVYAAGGGRLAQESLESSQKVAQWFAAQLGRTDLNQSSKLQILERMAAKTEALGHNLPATSPVRQAAEKGALELRDLGEAWGQQGMRMHVPFLGAPAAAEDLAKGLAGLFDTLSEKGMPRLARFAESGDILPGRQLAERLSRGVEIPGLRGEQIAAAKAGAKRAVGAGARGAAVELDEFAKKHPKLLPFGEGSQGQRLHRAFLDLAERVHNHTNPGSAPWATNVERIIAQQANQFEDVTAAVASKTAGDIRAIGRGNMSLPERELITKAIGAVQDETYATVRNPKGASLFDFARIPEDAVDVVRAGSPEFNDIGTTLSRSLSRAADRTEATFNWTNAVQHLVEKYGPAAIDRQAMLASGQKIISDIAGPPVKGVDNWATGIAAVRAAKTSPVRDAMNAGLESFGLVRTPMTNTNLALAAATERAYAMALHLEHEGLLDPAKHTSAMDWFNDVGRRSIMQAAPAEQRALLAPHVDPILADISANLPASAVRVEQKWNDLDRGLRPVAQYFKRKFEEIIKEERRAGLEPESMPGFVPLLMRNKDSIFKKIGLREASFGEIPKSELGRRVRSLDEASDLKLDPIRDIFRLYGAAKHEHEIKMRGHKFTEGIVKQFGRDITNTAAVARAKGTPQSAALRTIEHMGKTYEVDPDVAKGFEKVAELWKPEKISDAMATWSAMTNWWKARATVGRLGFHARNAWSNMWNMYAGGWSGKQFGRAVEVGLLGYLDNVEARALGKAAREASPVRMGGPVKRLVDRKIDGMYDWLAARAAKAEKKQVVDQSGRVWTYRQLYDEARAHGIIDKGWVAAEVDDIGMKEFGAHPDYATARGVMSAANPFGKQFVGLRMGGAAGKGIENHARMTLFLDRVLGEAGEGTLAAAQHVKKYLFDYKALTPAEKTLKRVAVPFYTWVRKNLPLQMEQVFLNPGRMALPFKLKRTFDKRYDDLGGQILDEEMPAWMRNAYGMRVPGQPLSLIGMSDIGSTAVWMPDMPYRDLNMLKLDDGEGFFSQINPLLKMPFELNLGKTLTRERTFKMVEVPRGVETILSTMPGVKIVPFADEATGRTVNMVDERVLYVLQTMMPDVFTWQRLLVDRPKDPVEAEKSKARQLADVTGIGRVNYLRPEQERGQRMKEKAETIRQWTPRGAKVKTDE